MNTYYQGDGTPTDGARAVAEGRLNKNTYWRNMEPQFRATALTLWKKDRFDRYYSYAEILSIVHSTYWDLICHETTRNTPFDTIRSIENVAYRAAKRTLNRDHCRAWTIASGTTSLTRRLAELDKTRQHYEQTGTTPTIDHLINETNTRLARTRKNPAKQGMILTRADLTSRTDQPLTDHHHSDPTTISDILADLTHIYTTTDQQNIARWTIDFCATTGLTPTKNDTTAYAHIAHLDPDTVDTTVHTILTHLTTMLNE